MARSKMRSMDAVIDEAADWIVRLSADDASADDRQQFVAWLKRSPVHMEHFLRAEEVWAQLSEVDPGRKLDVRKLADEAAWEVADLPFDSARETDASKSTSHRSRLVTLAAGVILAIAGAFLIQSHLAPVYSTNVGEQRTVRLPDGSTLMLNTSTRAVVRFSSSKREIELREGEGLFKVAKEQRRPFIVRSGDAEVQAIGTEFIVRRDGGGTAVTVIEGRVNVASTSPEDTALARKESKLGRTEVQLDAGRRAEVRGTRVLTKQLQSLAPIIAWQSRRLVFEGEALATVASEFNRYNENQIVIQGDELGKERISGVFDVDQPQALVRFLERAGAIRPALHRGRDIVLEARTP